MGADPGVVISDMAADKRDTGGPVYVLTNDNRATIVGLADGTANSAPEAESWQAVMQQVYVDLRSHSAPDSPAGVHLISRYTPSPAAG